MASKIGLQQVLVFIGKELGGGVVRILYCALWGSSSSSSYFIDKLERLATLSPLWLVSLLQVTATLSSISLVFTQ